MKLSNARSAKAAELDRDVQEARASRVVGFGSFADVPVYTPVRTFGVCEGQRKGDYALYAVVRHESEAELLRERYGKECQVRVIEKVEARNYTRARHRPIEPGLSIAPIRAPWSGTIGFFHGSKMVTNHHVAEADIGTAIVQPSGPDSGSMGNPGDVIGILERLPPIDYRGGVNYVDCALVGLNPDEGDWSHHNAAIQGEVTGYRALDAGDLGAPVRKMGRTTEATAGTVTAVEIDALFVDYGQNRIGLFNDQHEFSLPGAGEFSDSGDSGSAILIGSEIVSLLFAGGTDRDGHDRTFGNPILRVLDALELVA